MEKLRFNYCKSLDKKKSLYNNLSSVFKKSFDQTYNKKIYNWKYLNVNSSESIIQEIIVNDKPAGYRGLWKVKNYPNFFQCIDTCIHPDFQGKGIFKLSNQNLVSEIGSFYNYPNQKSKPGYIKSGWREISKMNIYLNEINNFEFCDWGKNFLEWRFVSHPYIKYYKVKLREGYAILRFKKGFPIHIESIRYDIDLQEIRSPLYSLKYDLEKNGLKVKNAGSILGLNFKEKLRSSYFDMI